MNDIRYLNGTVRAAICFSKLCAVQGATAPPPHTVMPYLIQPLNVCELGILGGLDWS
jgi:hypothetical protein